MIFFDLKIPNYTVDNAACNVAKGRIKDVDKLCSHILTAWDELDQHVIDMAVRQWHTRLHVCVKAKGKHFEHKLSQQFRILLLLLMTALCTGHFC